MADDLSVAFGRGRNRVLALDGFHARFGPWITGLVGPNGAGKSTLLRAMCGLLDPIGGSISIGGRTPDAFVSRRGLGFLPEAPPLPGFLTVEEFLAGLGWGTGVDVDPASLGGGVKLDGLWGRRMDSLSLGQRKKCSLAAALLGGPTLLLLDEPTNGLDPRAVAELRETLTAIRQTGMTVIVSSHHLDELQRIADVLVFVSRGRAVGSWARDVALGRFGSFDALYEAVLGDAGS